MTDYLIENGIKAAVFWVVGMVAALLVLWIGGLLPGRTFPAIPQAKWQAVFLANNQVYFGKLADKDAQYVTLSDVYYLRTASDLQQKDSSGLNLIKLGGEVHGPEDVLYIPKSEILYWENLKDSSQIVQTIQAQH